jgi:hypothetical protein
MNAIGRIGGLFLFTILIVLGVISSAAWAASQTFTGTVGDAMCGAKHVMSGDDASCTHGCISKGSKYALLIGDKVYVLDTTDQALLARLDKQAGKKITISGTRKDDTITVTSVRAAQ